MDDDLLEDTEEDRLLDAAALAAAAEPQVEEPSAVEYARACRRDAAICCSQWTRACVSHATEVMLCHYGLGKRGAPPFAASLSVNTHVQTLDLGDNGLGSEGIAALLGALAVGGAAPALRTLSLRQNQAGEEGADAVAELLRSSHSLGSLDFGANAIGNKGAAAVAEVLAGNRTLSALSLDHNEIEDEGAEHVARALGDNRTLTSLSLEWNGITGEGGRALAEALGGKQPVLCELNVGWNGLGDAAVVAIARAIELCPPGGPLRDVRLHHNRATQVAAAALARALGSLQLLDVSGNPLGTAGAAVMLLAQQENRVTVVGSPRGGGAESEGAPAAGGAGVTAALLPRCQVLMEDVCVRPDTSLAGLLVRAASGDEITHAELETCGVNAAAAVATAAAAKAKAEAKAAAAARGGGSARGKSVGKGAPPKPASKGKGSKSWVRHEPRLGTDLQPGQALAGGVPEK